MNDDIPNLGFYLPIKGIPSYIYNNIRTNLFKKLFNKFTEEYWKPDVIHIHFPLLVINDDILTFLLSYDIKIVITEHWTKVQKKEISYKSTNLLKRLYNYSHSFICVSEDLKRSIEDLIQIDNSNIKVIPNMVSDIFFHKGYQKEVSKNKFSFTFIGRLTKIKRVDMLIIKGSVNNYV